MKRLLFVLLLGCFLGYWYSSPLRKQNNAAAPVIPQGISDSLKIPSLSAAKEKISQINVKTKEEAKDLASQFGLHLSEERIASLESSFAQLREGAATQFSDIGWRVKLLAEDSELTKLGIKNGDVILRSSLERWKKDPALADLAERVENILRNLEQ
jgi:hypothetical protein